MRESYAPAVERVLVAIAEEAERTVRHVTLLGIGELQAITRRVARRLKIESIVLQTELISVVATVLYHIRDGDTHEKCWTLDADARGLVVDMTPFELTRLAARVDVDRSAS